MAHTPHIIPVEAVRLLVFDLDGTLIDSRQDLVNSVNAMLNHLGRPHLPDDVIASHIGDGAGMLVRRALGHPEDESHVEAALTYFLDFYRVHKLDYTHVYPGVLESLEALRLDAGWRRAQDGSTDQQAGESFAGDLRCPRSEPVFLSNLWRQQFCRRRSPIRRV